MSQMICLRHSKIDSKVAPELSCKTCCTIFVNAVRERRKETESKASEWMKAQQNVITSEQKQSLHQV